jgi:hydrogenase/urease accessory protein HupE
MALGFVIAMIVVLPFVLIAVWSNVPSTGIRVVLVASCAVVLVYNIASMFALINNYRRDRDFIYRRDVAHLRERAALRAAKGAR